MQHLLYLIAIVTYSARSLFFMIGAARERKRRTPASEAEPHVSIIVPARNEEHHIEECVQSLMAIEYPLDVMQIIVVNDRSTDSTGEVLSSLQKRYPRLIIATITNEGEKNLRGKAGALDVGCRMATGEIILLTDADCRVKPGWVRAHVREYVDPSVGMVLAYTLAEGNSFFAHIQSVEWQSTHTMAAAAVNFRQYLGCYGNNMSVRRSVYENVGGYAAIPFSVTEDLALLQTISGKGYVARYLCTAESAVTTFALDTMKEYMAQHKRWTLGAKKLGFRAAAFVATSLALWSGIFAAIVYAEWWWIAVILGIRIIEDVLIIAPSLVILNKRHLLRYTVPAVLFFTCLELSLPFLIIDRTAVWKGQRFKM